ncbi:MAG: hypothetical protein ACI81R_001315 [Bradymonadia bacterium]
MSSFDAQTPLLLTRIGTQAVAFTLDDVVRIGPWGSTAARFLKGDDEEAVNSDSERLPSDTSAEPSGAEHVPVLDLATHLEEAAVRARCVLECQKGQLLLAGASTVQTLGDQLVCEIPVLVRHAVHAAGIQRVIWDGSGEQWRLWLRPERLLDHADPRQSATTEEEAA